MGPEAQTQFSRRDLAARIFPHSGVALVAGAAAEELASSATRDHGHHQDDVWAGVAKCAALAEVRAVVDGRGAERAEASGRRLSLQPTVFVIPAASKSPALMNEIFVGSIHRRNAALTSSTESAPILRSRSAS